MQRYDGPCLKFLQLPTERSIFFPSDRRCRRRCCAEIRSEIFAQSDAGLQGKEEGSGWLLRCLHHSGAVFQSLRHTYAIEGRTSDETTSSSGVRKSFVPVYPSLDPQAKFLRARDQISSQSVQKTAQLKQQRFYHCRVPWSLIHLSRTAGQDSIILLYSDDVLGVNFCKETTFLPIHEPRGTHHDNGDTISFNCALAC